jgi:hypothetical protein
VPSTLVGGVPGDCPELGSVGFPANFGASLSDDFFLAKMLVPPWQPHREMQTTETSAIRPIVARMA